MAIYYFVSHISTVANGFTLHSSESHIRLALVNNGYFLFTYLLYYNFI